MKYIKQAVLILFIIFTFQINIWNREINITLEYGAPDGITPQGQTTLYYKNGYDYREDNSVYAPIEGMQTEYIFHPLTPLQGLRIIPTRDPEQAVYIKSLSIYVNNTLKQSFSGNEFKEKILLSESAAQISFEHGLTKVQYNQTDPWPYIAFDSDILKACNAVTALAWLRTILILFIFFLPFAISYISDVLLQKCDVQVNRRKYAAAAFSVCLLLLCLIKGHLGWPGIIFLWILPFCFFRTDSRKFSIWQFIIDGITMIFSMFILVYSSDLIIGFAAISQYDWPIDYVILAGTSWIGSMALYDFMAMTMETTLSSPERSGLKTVIFAFCAICVSFTLYECMKVILKEGLNIKDLLPYLIDRIVTPVYLMNLLWGTLFLITLIGIAGLGIGTAVYGIIYLVLFIGNIIKIHFHNTLLTPLDFLQIEEMFKMAETVLGRKKLLLLIFTVIALLCILVITRRHWCSFFKPSFNWGLAIVPGFLCICLTYNVVHAKYESRNVFYKGYENEFINERYDGVAFYNLINLSKLHEVFMKAPDGYSEDTVMQLKARFPNDPDRNPESEITPNVILIMAESLFDIENIDGIQFNSEIEPTLHKYKKGTLISPRYGGYTSAVEYEALTGLSLAFYPPGLVPYTTYFNQRDLQIPSIAREFADNGYMTYAIHPNEKTFYNRDTAYSMLGFQTFLDKNSFEFTPENTVAHQFLRDLPVAEKIESLIDENEQPVFVFGITIAGHYVNETRFPDTDITAQSNSLSENELKDIIQTAAAYKETDEMFKHLVDYVQSSNEPTLLYIFGDHLPPLPAFNTLPYTQDKYNKYGTCLAAFSNYRDIIFPEYVTPNQIAAQIMQDSGISHSSYYDFIFSLRDQYPVIQSEFCDISQIPEMDIYRMIQYDIMFGEQWFYEGEN